MRVNQLFEADDEHIFASMLGKLKPEIGKAHVYYMETDRADTLKLVLRMYPSTRTKGAINIEVEVPTGGEWYVTLFANMFDDYTIRKISKLHGGYSDRPRWVIVRKDHAHTLEPLK